MGNAIKGHIQRAEKTGVCQLASMNLTEVISNLCILYYARYSLVVFCCSRFKFITDSVRKLSYGIQ